MRSAYRRRLTVTALSRIISATLDVRSEIRQKTRKDIHMHVHTVLTHFRKLGNTRPAKQYEKQSQEKNSQIGLNFVRSVVVHRCWQRLQSSEGLDMTSDSIYHEVSIVWIMEQHRMNEKRRSNTCSKQQSHLKNK